MTKNIIPKTLKYFQDEIYFYYIGVSPHHNQETIFFSF